MPCLSKIIIHKVFARISDALCALFCLSFVPSGDLPVDDQIADQEAKAILHDNLMFFGEQLKGKEATIFDKRLLAEDPMTLQEIGEKFGISRERVRQIESRLKKKMKAYLEEKIADIDLLQESMIEI